MSPRLPAAFSGDEAILMLTLSQTKETLIPPYGHVRGKIKDKAVVYIVRIERSHANKDLAHKDGACSKEKGFKHQALKKVDGSRRTTSFPPA